MTVKNPIKRITSLEKKYVLEVLESEFRSSKNGLMLTRLEEQFARIIGVKFAIGHINGTATLHSALYAAGVQAGDEVIVPPLTMSSTSMAVLQQDAIPVFADIDEKTFNISPASIGKNISRKTKAIIPVALYGLSPDLDRICEIAKKHSIAVVEDDAQALLSKYKGKIIGSQSDISSFSFQSSKHITAGEGGMVCTNDLEIAQRVRKFSVLGYASVGAKKGRISIDDIQNPNYDRHVMLGFNYRMPDLCAAVLLGQLQHIDELVERRKQVAQIFLEEIRKCRWLIPQETPKNCENSFWSLAVRLVHPKITWQSFRKEFINNGGDGIYAAWKLSYLEPMFQERNMSGKTFLFSNYGKITQEFRPGLCPVAEKVQQQILAFKTNYWDLNEAKIQAKILKMTIQHFELRTRHEK